jgi:hypothetical protein
MIGMLRGSLREVARASPIALETASTDRLIRAGEVVGELGLGIAQPLEVDHRGPDPVNLVCMLGALVSAAVLAAGARAGVLGLAALILGTLLLDVAMQSGMVANQARVFTLRPDAHSRPNTAYMSCAFLGGSVGSWLGVRAYS